MLRENKAEREQMEMVCISEKLVTILLYLSITDYHNSFLVSILFQAVL